MKQFKVLVLTDHSNHKAGNSLYPLARIMCQHPNCAQLDVATRGNNLNDRFFKDFVAKEMLVSRVDEHFTFSKDGEAFLRNRSKELLAQYDVIWLRLPPPLSPEFLAFLTKELSDKLIINAPEGIFQTGSKAFLMNFPDICPPMKICRSVADIKAFKNQFPIVLKPFREYGGRGIVKIDGDRVQEGKQEMTFDAFVAKIKSSDIEYLGVKFLKNVSQGDKRIVVVNGKIMEASLRLPPKDSWICNVAMGGSFHSAHVDEEEAQIIERINPTLSEMGIVMYGIDTLVDDDGKRILSEINATSIGGLPQAAKLTGKPLVEEAIDLIWNYITEKKLEKDAVTKRK